MEKLFTDSVSVNKKYLTDSVFPIKKNTIWWFIIDTLSVNNFLLRNYNWLLSQSCLEVEILPRSQGSSSSNDEDPIYEDELNDLPYVPSEEKSSSQSSSDSNDSLLSDVSRISFKKIKKKQDWVALVSQPCWVEVDWSWRWLKLRLIEVEVDWSWGWLELRLIEVEVDWS